MSKKVYACIDLKSFYASVECRERGLDPLKTHLVVADETRTDGTICLAVSPSLKDLGVPGRPRLFEVKQKVRELNLQHPDWELDYLVARPRMKLYMQYSARIYGVYLDFVAEEDILVYSVDEVFIDLTQYLKLYGLSAEELTARMIEAVHARTGITATAGIGTNMYLAKVAMDIVAKHMAPNALGVRMAILDEQTYRERLWAHEPLMDFWRVGRGYARRLAAAGMRTMGDVARVSLDDEERLFKMFGVNAELLIDHAWGWEPCTLAEAKAHRPASHSLTEGQVLPGPYAAPRARVVVQEMADELALRMVRKHLVARQFVLMVCCRGRAKKWAWVRGTINISHRTSSAKVLMREAVKMYDQLVPPGAEVRKINLVANEVVDENTPEDSLSGEQIDLFGEFLAKVARERQAALAEKAERRVQRAVLNIKERYGKNAILRAIDFEDGATARKRNGEVGGHRA